MLSSAAPGRRSEHGVQAGRGVQDECGEQAADLSPADSLIRLSRPAGGLPFGRLGGGAGGGEVRPPRPSRGRCGRTRPGSHAPGTGPARPRSSPPRSIPRSPTARRRPGSTPATVAGRVQRSGRTPGPGTSCPPRDESGGGPAASALKLSGSSAVSSDRGPVVLPFTVRPRTDRPALLAATFAAAGDRGQDLGLAAVPVRPDQDVVVADGQHERYLVVREPGTEGGVLVVRLAMSATASPARDTVDSARQDKRPLQRNLLRLRGVRQERPPTLGPSGGPTRSVPASIAGGSKR